MHRHVVKFTVKKKKKAHVYVNISHLKNLLGKFLLFADRMKIPLCGRL